MEKSTPQNTLIIKAGSPKGFLYDIAEFDGYDCKSPYKPAGLIMRIIREICFRTPFLPKTVWYNQDIISNKYHYILVNDTLITVKFLEWLSGHFSESQLNFLYGNKIGHARHIQPNQIPSNYRIWSYDIADCEKYGIRLCRTTYHKNFVRPLKTPKYDVLFVGRDKGRLSYLLELKEKMKGMGLVPKFIIVKDSKLSSNNPAYKKEISYNELLDLITESRSILNIAMSGQNGYTMRDMESIFFGVKLLTTNEYIVNADFYNPNNIFVLKDLEIDGLVDFLKKPYIPLNNKVLEDHSVKSGVALVTSIE